MTEQEHRQIVNYGIACPLSEIEDPDMLAFVGSLIQDHDHMREKLMSERPGQKRREKYEAMRPHLKFKALSLSAYELAELARANGAQPIYQEQAHIEKKRVWMPPSFVHEVRG